MTNLTPIRPSTWGRWIVRLDAFIKGRGHNVPSRVAAVNREEQSLGNWVDSVRFRYRRGLLLPNQISDFESRGMVWSPMTDMLNDKLNQLDRFIAVHGRGPSTEDEDHDDANLYRWLLRQRAASDRGHLPDQNRNALLDRNIDMDSIPVRLDPIIRRGPNMTSDKMMDEIQSDGEAHPLTLHTSECAASDGTPLATLIQRLRRKKGVGSLTLAQAERFDGLMVSTYTLAEEWDQMVMRELGVYVSMHGDTLIPYSYMTPSGRRLLDMTFHAKVSRDSDSDIIQALRLTGQFAKEDKRDRMVEMTRRILNHEDVTPTEELVSWIRVYRGRFADGAVPTLLDKETPGWRELKFKPRGRPRIS